MGVTLEPVGGDKQININFKHITIKCNIKFINYSIIQTVIFRVT